MPQQKAILFLTITVISVFLFLIIANAVKLRKLKKAKSTNNQYTNLWADATRVVGIGINVPPYTN